MKKERANTIKERTEGVEVIRKIKRKQKKC